MVTLYTLTINTQIYINNTYVYNNITKQRMTDYNVRPSKYYLRNKKTSVPVFYRGNKIWVREFGCV